MANFSAFPREVLCQVYHAPGSCTNCRRGCAVIRVQHVEHGLWSWLCGACSASREAYDRAKGAREAGR